MRAVAFREGRSWVIIGLEYDLCTQLPYDRNISFNKLVENFDRYVISTILVNIEHGRKGLEGINPSPAEYHQLYQSAPHRHSEHMTLSGMDLDLAVFH